MRLTIDGLEVFAKDGMTVKEAAAMAGIMIPGLCDHPLLEPYGGCRLCIVQIDGIRGYPSSCTMPVGDGMVVRTSTEGVMELRRSILEMLLSEHPSICLTCERRGSCDEIREGMSRMPQAAGCRYCAADSRCELQETVESVGLKSVELPRLGEVKEAIHSPFFDRDPNLCILCGRCVRVCHDRGAGVIDFVRRGFDSSIAPALDMRLEDTGCRFCGACVDVCPTGALIERGGRWSKKDRQVTTICPYCSSNCPITLEVKGNKILRSVPGPSRLCVKGRFGLQFLSKSRLERPLMRKGGRLVEVGWDEAISFAADALTGLVGSFCLLTSGACTNEALFLGSSFATDVMKGFAAASDVMPEGSLPEDLRGRPIVVVGEIEETNPSTMLELREASPAVFIGSRKSALADSSREFISVMPGEEANALEALSDRIEGKENSSAARSDILAASEAISGALVVAGPDCSPFVIKAASRLSSACKGEFVLLGESCNSRGAASLGMSGMEDAFSKIERGRVSSAYVMGCNPILSRPDLAGPFSDLKLLIVQDLFLTKTAELAGLVLPAASFAECDGSFSGRLGMLSLQKAVQPPGLARPDWEILSKVAAAMGAESLQFSDQKEVMQGMSSCIPLRDEADRLKAVAVMQRYSKDDVRIVTDGEHPFVLHISPTAMSFGSGTRVGKVTDLEYLRKRISVEMNMEDAMRLHLRRGDIVKITSETTFEASVMPSQRIKKGMLRVAEGALRKGGTARDLPARIDAGV